VVIITKNYLVTRDIDVLRELARYDCVGVTLSLTTLDARLSSLLEPRASRPARRLAAIQALAEAGVPVGYLQAPMIPGLTDAEAPAIAAAAAEAGATFCGYVACVCRLPSKRSSNSGSSNIIQKRKTRCSIACARSGMASSTIRTLPPGCAAAAFSPNKWRSCFSWHRKNQASTKGGQSSPPSTFANLHGINCLFFELSFYVQLRRKMPGRIDTLNAVTAEML
jgi:hypothetical protein